MRLLPDGAVRRAWPGLCRAELLSGAAGRGGSPGTELLSNVLSHRRGDTGGLASRAGVRCASRWVPGRADLFLDCSWVPERPQRHLCQWRVAKLFLLQGGYKQEISYSGIFFFFFNVPFSQRETEHEWGRGRDRGRQHLKQAPGSELSAQSPTQGSNPGTTRS